MREFAVMAVHRQPPFKDRDQGFRDSVIFWSILDHAVASGKRPCILLAQDECFSDPSLSEAAKDAGIRWYLYPTVRHFIDEMHSRLGAVLRQSLDEDQERAREALLRIREAVEAFLTENLVFHDYELGIFLGNVRGIGKIAVRDIQNVRTSLNAPLPTTETEVKLSFEASYR